VVEAIEVAGHPFALGVQWHPEELATHLHDSPSRRLFADFVEQCRQYGAEPLA
jgi:gamma-glutamyl-gamma-aminobutyrate hydrolase PuuD